MWARFFQRRGAALATVLASSLVLISLARLQSQTGRGEGITTLSWEPVKIRNDTALARAVSQDPSLLAEPGEVVKRCLRKDADRDLAPALQRMRQKLGPQAAASCMRGARHFYCEALLDVLEPWPFQTPSFCKSPAGVGSGTTPELAASAAEMRLEAERDVALCFLIFMVDEVDAVQQLLRHRSRNDSAIIHVDARRSDVFEEMSSWAEMQLGVSVYSRWAVLRPGYSAGAALLDMLEFAVSGASWDTLLFLSGTHFWLRPRSELSRYLFYHQGVNFAATDEGPHQIDFREAVAPHYELHFECEGHLWRVTRDDSRRTILLPHCGHPNVTVAVGQPFVVLQRDFVEWLVVSRRERGSAAWTILRYTMRTFGNVEQMVTTLLLNSPWCNRINTRHDLTYALISPGDQELQHHAVKEGTEANALSAGRLGLADLEKLQVARWHFWSAYQISHGLEGQPPPVPQPIGMYRETSGAERAAMSCESKGCFQALSLYDPREASLAFAAFARKVDSALRGHLDTRVAPEPSATWVHADWPLARHVWRLWAPASCSESKLKVHRRLCDPRDEALPCALQLKITAPHCIELRSGAGASAAHGEGATKRDHGNVQALIVRERVGVGDGRIFAMQVGTGWDAEWRTMAMPGIVQHDAMPLMTVFFPAVRRRSEMISSVYFRLILLSPSRQGFTNPHVVNLLTVPKRGVAAFQPSITSWAPGNWTIVVERLSEDTSHEAAPAERSIQQAQVMAHRPFLVYQQEQELSRDDILRFFDVTL